MDLLEAYRQTLAARAEEVVKRLAEAVAAIPAERWHTPLAEGEWSPHELMAHLRDVEAQAYSIRLRRILEEDSPTLPAFDARGWHEDHYNPDEPMENLLSDYARLREEELALLRQMSPEQWSHFGRHDQFGIRTSQWWVECMLAHAFEHLQQLEAAAA